MEKYIREWRRSDSPLTNPSPCTFELPSIFRRAAIKGWAFMMMTVTVAGASVAAVSCYGDKRMGGILAATEVVVLTHRVRKALAIRP